MRPRPDLAIAIAAWMRPECLAFNLDHLARCEGIEGVPIRIAVDGGYNPSLPTVIQCSRLAPQVVVGYSSEHTGPKATIRRALDAAFQRADYVILAEEDIALAPDALDFHRWAASRFRDESRVLTACAYGQRSSILPAFDSWHACGYRSTFCFWGMGIWRDRWEHVRNLAVWDVPEIVKSADTLIDEWSSDNDYWHAYPLLSRANNVGLETTIPEHAGYLPEWYAANHLLPYWAGSVPVPKGEWTA